MIFIVYLFVFLYNWLHTTTEGSNVYRWSLTILDVVGALHKLWFLTYYIIIFFLLNIAIFCFILLILVLLNRKRLIIILFIWIINKITTITLTTIATITICALHQLSCFILLFFCLQCKVCDLVYRAICYHIILS